MQSIFQLKKFSEIKHLLPSDSWWLLGNNATAFENDNVALCEGDAVTDHIQLDFTTVNISLADETIDGEISLIIVTGNLQAKNIFNDETDGAVSLMVLGNLQADNMSVGGQEIYVAGDLVVQGLFWGDYNHGDLVVKGFITARVLMVTDEYHVDWKRIYRKENVNIASFINDDEVNGDYPREVMAAAFEEDCLLSEADIDEEIYSFKYWLNTEEISKRLLEGSAVLRKDVPALQEENIPFIFENEFPTDNNMERFRTSFLFSQFGSSGEALEKLEFWRGDLYTRITVQQNKPFSTNVYFQHREDYAVMIFYFEYEGTLRRAMMQKSLTGEDTGWHTLDVQNPSQHFKVLMETGWKNGLKEFSAMEHYQQQFQEQISIEKVKDMLALPVVKDKYSDYYNDDSEVLHIGNLTVEYRQEDNEQQRCPRICIIKSVPYAEDDSKHVFFHIDIEKNNAGNEVIALYTQDQDGYGSEVYNVSVTDTGKYKEALKYFALLEQKIAKLNNAYGNVQP